MKRITAALLAMAAMTSPAHASDFVGGWLIQPVEEDPGFCSAFAEFGPGNYILIRFNAKTGQSLVAIRNPDVTSLKDGDTIKIDIGMLNARGGVIDEYEGINFLVLVTKEMKGTILRSSYLEEFLPLVAKADSLAFAYDERPVGRYNMNGSARMTVALRNCSIRINGLNPRDPFLPR